MPACDPKASSEAFRALLQTKQTFTTSPNVIGPRVGFKLRTHSSDLEYGKSFPEVFCDLLLEIAQNAFRHGNATDVEIAFSEERITIQDNGSLFELPSINGDRGGASAWRRAKAAFLDSDEISFSARKATHRHNNRYFFDLKKVDKLLQHAKEHCRASIISNTVRPPMGTPNILDYDPECEAIYLNSPVRMTSGVLDIARHVRTLIAAGKTVLIACACQDQVLRFKEALPDIEPTKLRVFVESS